jgi:molybdopterin converting factor small subunit
MKVRILAFASYADALGRAEVEVEVPEPATVADCVAAVRALPGMEVVPPTPGVAVNWRYARPDQAVTASDEVALIPPVAGG